MSTSKGGRKSRTQIEAEARRKVLAELDEIALEAAPDALRTLAAGLKPGGSTDDGKVRPGVSREQISAATYILNQVLGRPSEKEPSSDASDDLKAFLKEVRELRRKRLQRRGTDPLVEPMDGLSADDGPVADPAPSFEGEADSGG